MEVLTKELVVASLISDAAKHNFDQLIANGDKMEITRENLAADYSVLLSIRDMYLFLQERRDAEDKPDKDRIKARKEGYDVYMKPMEAILEKAEPILTRLNGIIKREEKQIIGEIEKKNDVMRRHVDFVNDTTKQILLAPDNNDLARIQKLIGSEKSRTAFYGDYHSNIVELCDLLLGLINERKKIMKDNAKLEADKTKWLEKGDIVRATQITEQIEHSERVVVENANAIAQKAFEKISGVALLETNFDTEALKPRTHRWSWRVENIDTMYQKSPELVTKEPNKKAINALLKEKTDADELKEDEEVNLNGLIFYRKPFFVAI